MSFIFVVKVVPGSATAKWGLGKDGILKCYLKSQPERGRANEELVKLIAKALKITQAEVAIIAGGISRKKTIKVSIDITFDQLLSFVGIERQKSLFD
jgi:uncharacterized protein YggU (UPF0235/DUF167 family)